MPHEQVGRDRYRHALLSTGAAGAEAVARVAVSAASVPILISYLGKEPYGLAVTIAGIAGWSVIGGAGLDLSLKNALIRTFAEDDAPTRASELYSTAFWTILGVAVLLGVLFSAVWMVLPWAVLLNLAVDWGGAPERLVLLSVWLVLLAIPFGLARTYYSARQREYFFSPWAIAAALGSMAIVLAAALGDLGFLVAGSALLAGNLLGVVASSLWLHMREGVLRVRRFRRSHVGPLMKKGAAFLTLRLSAIFIFHSDIFIVNLFCGHSAAATYALHIRLPLYLQAIARLLVGPFWSALGDAFNRNDRKWFVATIWKLTIGVGVFCVAFGLALFLFAGPIMNAWSRGEVQWDPYLGATLVAFVLLRTIIQVPAVSLGAMRIARDPAKYAVLHAALNIAMSVCMVRVMGMRGVALASLASYALTSGWYVPVKLASALRGWRQH